MKNYNEQEKMENFLKKMSSKNGETKAKKKIENIIFLIIILVITLVMINTIWNGNEGKNEKTETTNSSGKVLADTEKSTTSQDELEEKLENFLSTIKNVGKVKVLINYSETSSLVPLYDETTTTSSTEEGDSSGGTRNVTETEVQKDVVFSEKSGSKEPVTQKTIMPTIQGAIITAEGASDATVRTNIINAVGAVTGLSIDKVQVFEMEK